MEPDLRITVGLCANCRHAFRTPHPRGGRDYWRCALAETDPRFERYPRLPVLRCSGYTAKENETRD
jgi:hypothetical protein